MTSHRDVANNWAQKTGKGRNGFNMFYEGDTIYSYGHHFPIARHTVDVDGEAVILQTTAKWSVSTAKHKGIVWSAAYGQAKSFTVADINAADDDAHQANLADYKARIEAALNTAFRARTYTEMYERDAYRLADNAMEYAAYFDALMFEYAPLFDAYRDRENNRPANRKARAAAIKSADNFHLTLEREMA